MKRSLASTWVAAVLFSAVAAIPFAPDERKAAGDYFFEARISASTPGNVRIYFEQDAGLTEENSVSAAILSRAEPVIHRLPLRPGRYRGIRFDPLDGAGTITVRDARLVHKSGRVLRDFPPSAFRAGQQIQEVRELDGGFQVVTVPSANDPQLHLAFAPALELAGRSLLSFSRYPVRCGVILVLTVGVAWLLRRVPIVSRFRDWSERHPAKAIAFLALAAAIVSCYPVVFLGRSFVSPNFLDGTFLLYERWPTLPGYTDTVTESAQGSDVGAIAWHHHPLSILEHRAIFHDHEWPLWNRYNSSGVPLLGQGQSMFGDPLHFIPIVANGAAWAWDLKYLIAKWLFACGLGLTVLRLTGHPASALLTTLSSAFIGFFLYRVNHPAFFSMCYAPWILYAWVRIVQASGWRESIPGLGMLILASYMEVTSGTAKEAYMLLLGLNFTGLVLLLASRENWRGKLLKLGGASGAGVLFMMLAAPIWLTFYDALSRAYTSYNVPHAFQIHPSLLIGLFDELFYRPIHSGLRVFAPSANFLVLLGVLYALATLRRAPADRMKFALGAAALVPLALAFGVVPPEWITAVPFLGNVAHIDNTFSCVALVHLLVFAGYGFQLAAQRLGTREGSGDLLMAGGLLLLLLVPYVALTQTVHRDIFGDGSMLRIQKPGTRMPVPGFVWWSLVALPGAGLVLAATVRRRLQRGSWTPALAILATGAVGVMLWRFGQQARFHFDPYIFNPATRVDFHAPSDAISLVQKETTEPYRVVGLDSSFTPGWTGTYGLETISGPDAIANPHYREFLRVSGLKFVWDWRVIVERKTLAKLRRIYDFLNVRTFLDLPRNDPQMASVLRAGPRLDFDIYTNDTAWPRAFFTDRVTNYTAPADFVTLLNNGDGRPFAAVQGLDWTWVASLSSDLDSRSIVPARDYALTTNTTSFTIEAPSAGLVVLGEAWIEHDVRATLNGQAVPCLRVNHAFRGIAVPAAGAYRVEFTYRPRFFTASLVISGVALVGCGLLVVWETRTRRHPTATPVHAA